MNQQFFLDDESTNLLNLVTSGNIGTIKKSSPRELATNLEKVAKPKDNSSILNCYGRFMWLLTSKSLHRWPG
jgi:hypothetical protein